MSFSFDLDRAASRPIRAAWDEADRCLEPLVDVQERDTEFVVTVDLPCVARKEDIKLFVSEQAVELSAEFQRALQWARWGTVQKRVEFHAFRKALALPTRVDADKARAAFRNGVLRVTLPKLRRSIPISVE